MFECENAKSVWDKICTVAQIIKINVVDLDVENVLFGMKENDRVKYYEATFYNFIIFTTKWILWKHRNDVKYGNTIVNEPDVLFKRIIEFCKKQANIVLNSKYNKSISNSLKCMLLNFYEYEF